MKYFYIIITVVLFLFLVYLAFIAPRARRKFKLPKSGYAHRGLWNTNLPENSISAFKAAIEAGFGIETDVRLTSDRIPVIFHDDTLLRLCGEERRVDSFTYKELCDFRLCGSDETIPTFSEFLELVNGQVPLLIELKGVTYNTELCDIIVPLLNNYTGEFVVESFNPLLLKKIKQLLPHVIRGQLFTNPLRRHIPGSRLRNIALSAMLTNFLSRPDFIAYDMEYPVNTSLFFCTRLLGARRCVWTVRDIESYKKFINRNDCPIFEKFKP